MTATRVQPKRIGPYTAGEIPPPFTYQFLESDGITPVVLTGLPAHFNLGATELTATARSATVTDGPLGKVTYFWAEDDIPTAGAYFAQFWVGDDSTLYASHPLIFNADAAVGIPPAV